MRFPTGTEVTRLRSRHGNRSRVYLGVQRGKERTDAPPPLMVGMHYQLAATDVYDATAQGWHTITFAGGFLNGSDIRPNMTLAVGTRANPFLYGSARIRLVDAGNNRLCLEMNNLNALGYLAAGDYIWVDGVYRLYRILPRIVAGVVKEDGNWDDTGGADGIPGRGIGWTREYYYRPVALMGSPRFAWAGEPINFYGWRSHGRGTRRVRYTTWDFDGGACLGPGLTYAGSPANPIRVRWGAAGEYVASLVVRDDSGDAALDAYGVRFDEHRAVRPVLVYDRPGTGSNPPYTDFEVSSLTGRYGSGWSCRITVHGTADASEFPDNALIILFAEDWHGGVQGSIGGWYGQEGILFVGHVRADSVTVDSEKSTVSFEAQTIEQWMKDISVWPANFVDPGGGANAWHEFNNMTIEDILWHLAEVHSNLKHVTDCFFASDVGAEKAVHFLDLTEASLYDQMSSQIGSCFFGQLSASRHGSVHLFKHKNMMDLVERTWWGPPVFSFSKQDWRDELEIGEERMRDSVAQVDMAGFVYDANGNPLDVFSLAPARQTNFGRIEKVTGVLLTGTSIALGQAENNTFSGLYLAKENIRFPHIRVPAVNNRILEPSELDYFSVNLVAADTTRGYVWQGKEFLTTGVSITIDNETGIITVDVEGEASTWGPDGVAGEYPAGPPAEPPNDNPWGYSGIWPPGATPGNPAGDPPPWADAPAYAGMTAYLALGDGHVIRGIGLGPGIGHGCRYHNCGQVHNDWINWMALDQFDLDEGALLCTTFRIYKTTNLSDDAPNWTQVFPFAGGDWGLGEIWSVRSSELQEDLWMAVGFDDTGGDLIYVWWSTQGGRRGTWNQRTFAGPGGDPHGNSPFLELSTHDVNKAWVTYVDKSTNRTYVAYTDDMWATAPTFTLIPAACFNGDPATGPCSHHRRYDNANDSQDIFGGTEVTGAPHDANVYLGTTCATLYNDGATWPRVMVRKVGCGVGTRHRWWALAYGNVNNGFWTYDAGVWTEQNSWVISTNGLSWYLRDCKNYRGDWRWYAVTRDGASYPVAITVDRGGFWDPQWGDWRAVITDEGLGDPNVVMICSSRLLPA